MSSNPDWMAERDALCGLSRSYDEGMPARDIFAIAAMQGMLAHATRYKPRPGAPANWHDAISEEAYEIADAMLRARASIIVARPAQKRALESALEYIEADLAERFSVSGQNVRDEIRVALALSSKDIASPEHFPHVLNSKET